MSRIGKLPIPLTQGVKVTVLADAVTVQGPKGALTQPLPPGITAATEGERLVVKRKDDTKRMKALHGLVRALLANAVNGVTKGFTRELEIQGVGYRAQVAGGVVNFSLGYTHPIDFAIPAGILIAVDRQTKITVSGADRQKVGQVAAKIRALRPPDVYKGKGIRYVGEVVRKKAGKTGAK
jgi:large subunit ribosomal protein L6